MAGCVSRVRVRVCVCVSVVDRKIARSRTAERERKESARKVDSTDDRPDRHTHTRCSLHVVQSYESDLAAAAAAATATLKRARTCHLPLSLLID